MLPRDLAKTAILMYLADAKVPQEEGRLIPVVNAYSNNNPYAAMEPAKKEMIQQGWLEQVKLREQRGFFTVDGGVGLQLTAAGEAEAARLNGHDPAQMKANVAFDMLTRASEAPVQRPDTHMGVNRATACAVFQELIAEGSLRSTQQGRFLQAEYGAITEAGRKKLAQFSAPAA